MASSNFSIENILSAAKSFSPSTTAMMLNAQQAFMALNSLPLPHPPSFPNPFEYINPYAFPPTTSQNPFAAAQFPFLFAAGGFAANPYSYPSPFIPAVMNGKRKRRHRTIFSEHQLNILEKTFNTVTHYPDVQLRDRLAAECQLKEERVEVWFKNRRAKDRKKNPDEKKSSGGKADSGTSGNGSSTADSLHSDEEEEDLELSDIGSDTEQHHHQQQHPHQPRQSHISPSKPTTANKRKRSSNSSSESKNSKYAKIESRENIPEKLKITSKNLISPLKSEPLVTS